jgi:hypothetical protein
MPVEPVAPADPVYAAVAAARFDQYRAIVVRYWRALLGRAMRVQLPERKVVDTFYSSIVQDALSRYQLPSGAWVQAVNKLRYHAFWLRDGAIITNMYDLVGLHDLARQNLEYFPAWQRDDGLFISRSEEYDGFGQALWAMGEHVRRTGNADFARRMLPSVTRAMAWFERQRASDPGGLMPPNANLQDNDNHCGTCGHRCLTRDEETPRLNAAEICSSGACVDCHTEGTINPGQPTICCRGLRFCPGTANGSIPSRCIRPDQTC